MSNLSLRFKVILILVFSSLVGDLAVLGFWQPRYLAASGGLSPLIVMTDVAALVGGGLKGVISR